MRAVHIGMLVVLPLSNRNHTVTFTVTIYCGTIHDLIQVAVELRNKPKATLSRRREKKNDQTNKQKTTKKKTSKKQRKRGWYQITPLLSPAIILV